MDDDSPDLPINSNRLPMFNPLGAIAHAQNRWNAVFASDD